MLKNTIEKPELNSIIFRYLLAHAEQPQLLANSKNPFLQEFATRNPFYTEFVETVFLEVEPEVGGEPYNESRLLQIGNYIPQKKFKEILTCFKELSGIKNPLHYSELGRIIPFVQSGFKEMAGPTLLSPGKVVKASAEYNQILNNDQKIAIERIYRNGTVNARVQHYFLNSAEQHYLEMVTAALGYWEGIPLLWDWHKLGETNLFEVQIPLEDLIAYDYNYLNLDLQEDKGEIFINGDLKGKRIKFDGFIPKKEYVTQPLNTFTPVEIIEDVIVDGDLIFPAGTKYGMPCNRYDLSIPDPGTGRRVWYFLKRVFRRESKGFEFMDKDKRELDAKHKMLGPKMEALKRQKAEIETEKARAETEKARADTAEARAQAAEARVTLEKQVSEVNRVFADLRGLAHDNKNHMLVINSKVGQLFSTVLQQYPNYLETFPHLQENPEQLIAALAYMKEYSPSPLELITATESYSTIIDRAGIIMDNEKIVMAGGIPIEIEEILYTQVMNPVLESVATIHPGVKLTYEFPEDMMIKGDLRLLKVAFTNLLHNAAEASPGGEVKLEQRQMNRAARTFSIIDIYQTGYISPDKEQKLNSAEMFTDKKEGNGVGAAASYNIITGPHHGKVKYNGFQNQQYGGRIRIMV